MLEGYGLQILSVFAILWLENWKGAEEKEHRNLRFFGLPRAAAFRHALAAGR